MTVYLPRRFLVAAASAALLALVAGLLLLSGSDGDGPVSAIAGGVTTLATVKEPKPSTTGVPRRFPPVPAVPAASTTAVPLPPTTEAPPPPTTSSTASARRPGPGPTTPRPTPADTAPPVVVTEPPPPSLPPTTVAPSTDGSYTAMAARVVAAHNQERVARGLPPLQRSSCLDRVAGDWAVHLALLGQLVHNRGSGAAIGSCLLWQVIGENIGYDGTVDDLEQAWMESPVHQANILDPKFTQIGVGITTGPNGLLFVVVNFAG